MLENLRQQWQGSGFMRWYRGREPNERVIIAALGALLAVALLWSLIWKPVADWQVLEANRHRNALETLEFMRANEARARQAAQGRQGSRTSSGSLMPVITRAAEAGGVTISRLQPESDGGVSVVLQAQPFNQVLSWLARLQERNGVEVERISLDAEGRPGLVNGQLRLQ